MKSIKLLELIKVSVDLELKDIFGDRDPELLSSIENTVVNTGNLRPDIFYVNIRSDGTEVLLEGHTRQQAAISKKEYINPEANVNVEYLNLASKAEEKFWIRTYQKGRRNLNKAQSRANERAIGDLYTETKQSHGTNQHTRSAKLSSPTSHKIAKDNGLGESTVRNYATVANNLKLLGKVYSPKSLGEEVDPHYFDDLYDESRISQDTLKDLAHYADDGLFDEPIKKILYKAKEDPTYNIRKEWEKAKAKVTESIEDPSPTPTKKRTTSIKEKEIVEDQHPIEMEIALEEQTEKYKKGIHEKTRDALIAQKQLKHRQERREEEHKKGLTNIELITRNIELLMDKPGLKEDGATPSDTAFFMYKLRGYIVKYFENNRDALHIIQG